MCCMSCTASNSMELMPVLFCWHMAPAKKGIRISRVNYEVKPLIPVNQSMGQSWALNTFLYLNTKYMLKMYLNTKY